jgi:phage/plasmid-associated DNA primase
VRAATTRYKAEEDKIALFIEENCVVGGSNFRVRGGQLYGAYQKWCEVIGEPAMTLTKFGRRIKKRSDITDDRSNGTWYIGIALRDDHAPQN